MTKTTKLTALGAIFTALSLTAGIAQNVTTNPYGDLSLDFRATGGTGAGTNLEVDLGQFSQFLDATPGQIINLSGINGLSVTDLQQTYGDGTTNNSAWDTRTDLLWSVAGSSYNHILSDSSGSIPRYSFFITATAPFSNAPQNTASAQNINTQINSLSSYAQTASSTVSGKVPVGDPGSYSTELGNAGPYGTTQFGQIERNANTSGGPATIDLYYSIADPSGNSMARDLGTFELFSNGNFEFVAAAAAVPEPSTWAMMAVGALMLAGCVIRRKSAARI